MLTSDRRVLSCWDPILRFGTLPVTRFAEGITSHPYEWIRIFDHPTFAGPFRNAGREVAEGLAAQDEREIEFLRKLRAQVPAEQTLRQDDPRSPWSG